ncbi:MAG: cytochrome c maturation protein CcmE [Eggerthellaceae bacterium]|nr:cytochrome c maturation protein CcmE [Eggerthellaceae bacterium]
MNKKMKRRLTVVSGVVVMVLIVVLAVVGGSTSAKTVSIADTIDGSLQDQKIQVSGNVVKNSYSTEGDTLTFSIYDPEGDPNQTLVVRYSGAASSTFGNEVTAICTGKIGADGVLVASEMVTKCPSKYESAESAIVVSKLLSYGDEVVGTVVKVVGPIAPGTLLPAGQDIRFVLTDTTDESISMGVAFDGALSEEVVEGSSVVVTGSLAADGKFVATDVALEA